MTRNLKALGLALIALFAMLAVVASAAHATEARFTCGTDATKECTIKVTHHPTALPGVFKTKAGNVECENFHAIGTMPDGVKQSQLTLTDLQYTECELGGLFATVTAGSCHRTMFSGNIVSGGATGSVDITQTIGTTCEIKITAGACTITVKPQTGLKSVTYTNVRTSTREEITAHTVIDQISYETSGGCPGGGAGKAEDGKYEETITMQAFNKANETEQTDLTFVSA